MIGTNPFQELIDLATTFSIYTIAGFAFIGTVAVAHLADALRKITNPAKYKAPFLVFRIIAITVAIITILIMGSSTG